MLYSCTHMATVGVIGLSRLTLSVGNLCVVVSLDEVDVAEVQDAGDNVQDVVLYVRRHTHHRHCVLLTRRTI